MPTFEQMMSMDDAALDEALRNTPNPDEMMDEDSEEGEENEEATSEDAEQSDEGDEEEASEDDESEVEKEASVDLEKMKLLEMLEKLLEREAAKETKPEKPAEPQFDLTGKQQELKALKREYVKAIAEAELDKAAELDEQMDALRDEISDYKLKQVTAKSVKEAQALSEQERFDKLLTEAQKNPLFNPDSKEYSQEAVDLANDLLEAKVNRGVSKTKALAEAIEKATKLYGVDKPVASKKTNRGLAEKVKAAKSQPPRGKSSDMQGNEVPDLRKRFSRDPKALSDFMTKNPEMFDAMLKGKLS
jgi:membrane-bound lytic murein transglycosylase B